MPALSGHWKTNLNPQGAYNQVEGGVVDGISGIADADVLLAIAHMGFSHSERTWPLRVNDRRFVDTASLVI